MNVVAIGFQSVSQYQDPRQQRSKLQFRQMGSSGLRQLMQEQLLE